MHASNLDASKTQSKMQLTKWLMIFAQVIGASLILAIVAQISVPLPFTPIPLAMSSAGVFLIALTLGSKKGTAAIISYLAQGSLGLPVFAGGVVNSLWFLGPRAGYLIGFVIAAFVIGKLIERKDKVSFTYLLATVSLGAFIISACGTIYLINFVGAANAFALGFAPFILGDILKVLFTVFSFKAAHNLLRSTKNARNKSYISP